MKQVILKAVYSKLTTGDAIDSVINGRRLSQHQRRTYQLLSDPDLDVIFNVALTGDGKSLAAYLPALRDNRCTIGLYPTNELSRDQERQVAGYVKQLSLVPRPQRVCRLSSEQLTEYAGEHNVSRQTELLRRIEQSEILLANPDIYHLIMNGYYLRPIDARDKVFNPLIKNFALTVFDEFHIFSAPQIVGVVNAMLLTRATHGAGNRKFLFLSATPSQQLLANLERAGLRYAIVEGNYRHALATEATINPDEYRRITHQALLCFDVITRPDRTIEQWMIENVENVIFRFFRENPGSRCAVILNSVGAVKRIVNQLRPSLQRYGISVGENTGFSTRDERLESLAKDVLIGTSTIDVGVDFKINLLIFEATDAGNFIQRLGRLGRHDGYEKGLGEEVRFDTFRAYALVPQFIHERLFEKPDADGATPLEDGSSYDRQEFFSKLHEVYPLVNDFERYAKRWGGLQSACVFLDLGRKEIKQAYEGVREKLSDDYERTFEVNIKKQLGRVRAYVKGDKQNERPILEVARSFRGGGALECGVIDLTVADEQQQFKTYDLPGLLTNCMVTEVLSEDEFKARAEEAGNAITKFRFCKLYLAIGGYRDTPTRWHFHLTTDLSNQVTTDLRTTTGVSVILTDNEFQNPINRHLKKLKLVYYIAQIDKFSAKRRKGLPQLFPLYPLTDLRTMNDPQPIYSIAFGQDALLMETVFFYYASLPATALII
ncbi:MAG: type I-D CRISPR-associated helicase Cas3' [Blastocatellia bacterium]|nr:type I-D CRISPR-associated helicase Cas3' [Blastocatellia bacterium]